jgi:hypothetical protein
MLASARNVLVLGAYAQRLAAGRLDPAQRRSGSGASEEAHGEGAAATVATTAWHAVSRRALEWILADAPDVAALGSRTA